MMKNLLFYTLFYLFLMSYVSGSSLQDRRIKKLQLRVRKIHALLKGIQERRNNCNETLYTVSGKVDEARKLVDHLYTGPLLTRMDLSRGNDYDNVLLKLPNAMEKCLNSYKDTRVSKKQAEITCLQQILWRYEEPPKERYLRRVKRVMRRYNINITDFITLPPTRRVRKEYRTLTKQERDKFHAALNGLRNQQDDIVAMFAEIHKLADPGAHGGPAFLPWHRVFLVKFENALREIDPSVTLPYWDSTLDNCMSNPTNSFLWTSNYLGNGAGEVVIGAFAGWTTNNGNLERAYGENGNLVSKQNVANLLSKCNFSDIIPITGIPGFKLEGFHNGVHNWVGGDMGFVGSAPYDPVFYLHHCFIDYLWEKFRQRQRSDDCAGIDRETNYPDLGIDHMGFEDPLLEIDDYTVKQGMSDVWTKWLYRYEDSPACENYCGGSDYFECDIFTNCCIPQKPRFPFARDVQALPLPGMSRTTHDPSELFVSRPRCGNKDADCHKQRERETLEAGRQVQPAEELKIIAEMVPRPGRGRKFVSESQATRSLRTLKEDLEASEKKVRSYKAQRPQK